MGLNLRQQRFAELVFQGRPAGRAYEEAGYESRGNVADSCAEKLMRNTEVADFLKNLRGEAKTDAVLSGREIRETLARCIKAAEKAKKWSAVATLTDKLNRMDQNYAPERIEHSGSAIDKLFGSINSKSGLGND